ncbi:MAG: hypothetical protein M1822_008464, partial [Bathelium mastoideum]
TGHHHDGNPPRRDNPRLKPPNSPRSPYQRQSWPPSPSVEDESEALAKEAGPASVSEDDSSDDACMRGSLNQEPIMLEVKPEEQARQLVRTPSTGSEKSKTASEASGSDSEASRRGRRKIARAATPADEAPEFAQRKPSPYAFARDVPKSNNRHSGESFLSPESISTPRTPRQTEGSGDHGIPTPVASPSRPRPARAASAGQTSFEPARSTGGEDAFGSIPFDNAVVTKLPEKAKPGQYSFTKAELEKKETRVKFSEGRDSESQTLKFDPRDRPSSIRRLTDTATTLPRIAFEPKSSRPSPLQAPSINDSDVRKTRPSPLKTSFAGDANGVVQRGDREKRESGYSSETKRSEMRPTSPAAPRGILLTPPASPRVKAPSHRGDNPISSPHSRAGSGDESTAYSRPTSPLPTVSDKIFTHASPKKSVSSLDRPTFDPGTSKERTRTQSQLSLPMRSDSLPPVPTSKKPANVGIVLPYPDDNVTIMPKLEDHIYPPSSDRASIPTPTARPRSPTLPSGRSDSTRLPENEDARPRLHSRHHTFTEGAPHSRDSAKRSISDNTEKSSTSDTPILPPCPRPDHSTKYTDWYTVAYCQDVDVCPDCLENVFLPSKFGKHFKSAPAKRTSKARRCDFSLPWMRLAWLLVLNEKRDNLNLFGALSEVAADERPCSGEKEEIRTWYGLKEDTKTHIPGFHVCSNCVSNLEALLPSLRGSFTRIHQAEPRVAHVCDFQTKNKHFASYLDTLVDLDTRARFDRRAPDLRSFVSLVKKTHDKPLPTCPRDNLIIDRRWYFIPQLPELTVCESCHDKVVFPAIKASHPIAGKFNPKTHHVRESSLGTSCQLYSPRMREVWRRAIERDDWSLLAQEARNRKATEMHLQAKHRSLRNQAEETARRTQGSQSKEEARLKRELERMAEEWKHWE